MAPMFAPKPASFRRLPRELNPLKSWEELVFVACCVGAVIMVIRAESWLAMASHAVSL
jgi:hypothetical protein